MENIIGFLVALIVGIIVSSLFLFRKAKTSKVASDLERLTIVDDFMTDDFSFSNKSKKETKYSKYTNFIALLISDELMQSIMSVFKINYDALNNKIHVLRMEDKISVNDIVLFKILGITTTILSAILGILSGKAIFFILAAITFMLFYLLPESKINEAIKLRRISIEKELPDWIDLLQSIMESGLTLQDSINRIIEYKKSYLSSEFIYAAALTKSNGGDWNRALHEMADRNDIPVLYDLVNNLITSEKRGTSISETLRRESDKMRTLKNLRIEEEAQKMTIKILPVILIFCFLPFFILLIAPAITSFLSSMK